MLGILASNQIFYLESLVAPSASVLPLFLYQRLGGAFDIMSLDILDLDFVYQSRNDDDPIDWFIPVSESASIARNDGDIFVQGDGALFVLRRWESSCRRIGAVWCRFVSDMYFHEGQLYYRVGRTIFRGNASTGFAMNEVGELDEDVFFLTQILFAESIYDPISKSVFLYEGATGGNSRTLYRADPVTFEIVEEISLSAPMRPGQLLRFNAQLYSIDQEGVVDIVEISTGEVGNRVGIIDPGSLGGLQDIAPRDS